MNIALDRLSMPLDGVARLRRHARLGLAAWRARRRERAELAALTSAELRDAGITPHEAQLEAAKPFWRA